MNQRIAGLAGTRSARSAPHDRSGTGATLASDYLESVSARIR